MNDWRGTEITEGCSLYVDEGDSYSSREYTKTVAYVDGDMIVFIDGTVAYPHDYVQIEVVK